MMKFNSSIASKLRRYFIGFAVLMLATLWIFQGYFLDSFYRYTKSNKITKLAHKIEASYLSGNLQDFTYDAVNTESHVQLINRNGIILVDTVGIPNLQIQFQNAKVYQVIFNSLEPGQGKVIDINAIDSATNVPKTRLSYALKLDDSVLLFIQTEMVPVSATVSTIQAQLIVVSAFGIIFALFISWQLSRKVSLPMIDITQGAKRIAKGNYDTEISATGYSEIESLSETLNTMRQDLKRVETMRNELLANVSHDLRTPLTMIQGYLELMKDFPEERSEANLDLIMSESGRLKDMIQNLLDLSRIQTGIKSLDQSIFNVDTWLEENRNRYRELFKHRNIDFDFEGADVMGDKPLLQQALDNLIQNAIKHTDDKVLVQGKRVGDTYLVSVVDFGSGISEENRDAIWDRYYTTDVDHARDDNSYGLGLSIVKRIFESHAITFGVKANGDKGSVFYFALTIATKNT